MLQQEQQSKSSKWLNDIWGLKKQWLLHSKESDVIYVKHITDYVQPWSHLWVPQRPRHIKEEGEVTLLPCESPWQADWGIPFQSALDEANQNLYDTVRNIPTDFWEKDKEDKDVLVNEHILSSNISSKFKVIFFQSLPTAPELLSCP